MRVTEWPNKLGFDIGGSEVWKHASCFRVFTPTKCARVSYEVTTNPAEAVRLTKQFGLSRQRLEEMPYHDANSLFETSAILSITG